VQWLTDTKFRCPTVAQLAWHAAAGNPTFQYEFARVPAHGIRASGSNHGLEVSYVFGTLEGGKRGTSMLPVQFTAVDAKISDVMQQ
jgi:carboxylesterase type B